MSEPLKKVSAEKYKAAKIRWRIKGNEDGPIMEGQTIIVPCSTCGGGAVKSEGRSARVEGQKDELTIT